MTLQGESAGERAMLADYQIALPVLLAVTDAIPDGSPLNVDAFVADVTGVPWEEAGYARICADAMGYIEQRAGRTGLSREGERAERAGAIAAATTFELRDGSQLPRSELMDAMYAQEKKDAAKAARSPRLGR